MKTMMPTPIRMLQNSVMVPLRIAPIPIGSQNSPLWKPMMIAIALSSALVLMQILGKVAFIPVKEWIRQGRLYKRLSWLVERIATMTMQILTLARFQCSVDLCTGCRCRWRTRL